MWNSIQYVLGPFALLAFLISGVVTLYGYKIKGFSKKGHERIEYSKIGITDEELKGLSARQKADLIKIRLDSVLKKYIISSVVASVMGLLFSIVFISSLFVTSIPENDIVPESEKVFSGKPTDNPEIIEGDLIINAPDPVYYSENGCPVKLEFRTQKNYSSLDMSDYKIVLNQTNISGTIRQPYLQDTIPLGMALNKQVDTIVYFGDAKNGNGERFELNAKILKLNQETGISSFVRVIRDDKVKPD